jgi:hypothetical protein
MTSLRPGMTIQVTVTATPVASDRPVHLPAGTEWPTPGGKRVIYRWESTGQAICSYCITDPAKVIEAREYGHKLTQVPHYDNSGWYCCADDCDQYGDGL